MHIIKEKQALFFYDGNHYYNANKIITSKELEKNTAYYIADKPRMRNSKLTLTPVSVISKSEISKADNLKIVDLFELYYPDIYSKVISESWNFTQRSFKIFSNGTQISIDKSLLNCLAEVLIKSWIKQQFGLDSYPLLTKKSFSNYTIRMEIENNPYRTSVSEQLNNELIYHWYMKHKSFFSISLVEDSLMVTDHLFFENIEECKDYVLNKQQLLKLNHIDDFGKYKRSLTLSTYIIRFSEKLSINIEMGKSI